MQRHNYMKYLRSYVIKRKDLDLRTCFAYYRSNNLLALNVIINPSHTDNPQKLSEVTRSGLYLTGIKINYEDIDNSREISEGWVKRQKDKYDNFIRSRNDASGSVIVE